ncbi:MFS transporter [Paenibacillus sp. MER TA 81-3]|uniref:MFS transporter n=1 Tax=Paenibacillus sp. MER TA 81-3 TaxID=2939573 RepID=UPI00203E66A8|nr:MFS transporter [Paenibacillus sp. MER TA 81-3]MCM3338362.1 MFS transporter [Paenibacillus sp. MER TA 81-3]
MTSMEYLNHSFYRKRQLRYMYVYMFMLFTPAAVFSSFFPLYYKDIGYSDAMYGLQNAVLPIVGMIGNYLIGYLSDKFAAMKPLLLALLLALIGVLFFVFHTSEPWTVMGLIFVFQFLWVPATSLTDSMAMLAARRLGDSYAVIRGCGAAGFAVSAVLIGWLLERLPGHASMGWIVMVLVGLTGCALLPLRDPRRDDTPRNAAEALAAEVSEESAGGLSTRKKPQEKVNMKEFWSYVFTRRFVLFMVVLIIYNMTLIFNDQYFSFMIRDMNGSSLDIGLGWMLPAATEVFVFLYLGRSGRQFRPLFMLALSAVIMAARALVIYTTDVLPLILFMQAVQGVGIALYFIYLAEYMMDLIPDRFRASGQAVMSVIISIGATMTGSLIGAFIYNQLGTKALYLGMGLLLLVSAAGFIAAERLEGRHGTVCPETDTHSA